MKKFKIILLFAFTLSIKSVFATTWDEPWQDKVIKESDYFVFAKVKSFDKKKGLKIEILKLLGGKDLNKKIKITDFYLLDLCSLSGGHGPEFHFDNIKECYFFIKKNEEGNYCIATPSTGFDYLKEGKVHAAYRHSYHQALVPVDIYEKTMTAIFNKYHNQSYDENFINDFVSRSLSLKPAGFSENEINTFFSQHVALECIYHLRLPNFYSKILPFLNDTSNFHNQVSAARALIAYNTNNSKQELIKIVGDSTRSNFVQVICVWTLSDFKPTELKELLNKMKETASVEDNGFGGNIMDPRVCTNLPSVKTALEKLVGSM